MTTPSNLLGVFCDIDDTLTVNGRLVPEVLSIMAEAQAQGLYVVPITGRPGGWVDHIARCWPVDGVVGENGGLWYWYDNSKLHRRFLQDSETRTQNRRRLTDLASTILTEIPSAALASDQPYRELDLAVDFCEDVEPLSDDEVDRIVELFAQAGAHAKVSSIHVNGWYGTFDKLAGFRGLHRDRWGGEPDPTAWAYFGDSANDEPMFRAFPLSVGVANVADFADRLKHPPRWITAGRSGDGFAELARALLDARA